MKLLILFQLVENFVMENNSVDIYEEYFMNESVPDDAVNQLKIQNVFRFVKDYFKLLLFTVSFLTITFCLFKHI